MTGRLVYKHYDNGVRSIAVLNDNGASSRVLNLRRAHSAMRRQHIPVIAPFFTAPVLQDAIIVKHRLRPHEKALFTESRSVATKLLLPLDKVDLRAGAWSIFVGEERFEEAVLRQTGIDLRHGSSDRLTLDIIDHLPSLDPFLLREKLRYAGIRPQQEYFSVSSSDLLRMFDYVRKELSPLARLSTGEAEHAHGRRLADKILNGDGGDEMDLLRQGFALSDSDFSEGLFAWRGFLYYSWRLSEMNNALSMLSIALFRIRPSDTPSRSTHDSIERGRRSVSLLLSRNIDFAQGLVQTYKTAFNELVSSKDIAMFREFLLAAPLLFTELGQCIGALDHIDSFWRFRFPTSKPALVSSEELAQLFLEFEDSLSGCVGDEVDAFA